MKAVPATNQAKGRRYQGLTLMRYSEADMATSDVATAPHARRGLSAKTLRVAREWYKQRTGLGGKASKGTAEK